MHGFAVMRYNNGIAVVDDMLAFGGTRPSKADEIPLLRNG